MENTVYRKDVSDTAFHDLAARRKYNHLRIFIPIDHFSYHAGHYIANKGSGYCSGIHFVTIDRVLAIINHYHVDYVHINRNIIEDSQIYYNIGDLVYENKDFILIKAR